jgi:hypothetical protein
MIVTLIQGFIIYILIVMIIRHLKPFVEHFNDYNDLKNELKNDIDNDNEKDNKNKKFHTQADLKSTSPLFKTKKPFPTSQVPSTFKTEIDDWEKAIPLFGSIDIDVRMRGASNRRGIPDMGTYDCQDITFQKKGTTAPGTTLSVSSNETDLDEIVKKNNTLEQCAKDCQGNENCNGFRYSKKSKTCILTKGVKILKGSNEKKYNVSKCLNRNKVYVYDEYGNLNPTWIKKGEYIYYPKIEQKANKSNNGTECVNLDINNMFYFKNCKDKPCYKIPEGVLNQCIEQSDISRNKTLVNPSYILNCPAGKHINNTDEPVECIKCAPGTYQDQKTSIDKKKDGLWTSSCKKCDKGTFTDVEGLAKCKKCIKGTYNDKKGANNCPTCQYNTFAGSVGLEKCVACATDKVSSANRTTCIPLKPIQVAFNKEMKKKGVSININIGIFMDISNKYKGKDGIGGGNMLRDNVTLGGGKKGELNKPITLFGCLYDDDDDNPTSKNGPFNKYKSCYDLGSVAGKTYFLTTNKPLCPYLFPSCTEKSYQSKEGYEIDRFLLLATAKPSTNEKYTLKKDKNNKIFIQQKDRIPNKYKKKLIGFGKDLDKSINTIVDAGSSPFQLAALNHCTSKGKLPRSIIPAIFIPTSSNFVNDTAIDTAIANKKFQTEHYIINMNINFVVKGLLYNKGNKKIGYKCYIKGTPENIINSGYGPYFLKRTSDFLEWVSKKDLNTLGKEENLYIFDVKFNRTLN